MKVNKIKEILKNKKIMTISGAVAGALIITVAGTMILHNRNKVEDKKQEAAIVVEDNTLEKQVKDQLEKLRKIGIEKLSEEDKKLIDKQIKSIEELVKNKEYDKAKKEIEIVNKDIDNKLKEIAKKDEKPKEEEKATEEKEENKDVASNTTENSTSNNDTSSNNTSNDSVSNNEYVAPPVVEQPSEPSYTPPVVEEPVQPTPPPAEPAPQPPVVETPSYPSVAEVQQRLIAYGQSLGLTYDPSINSSTEGVMMQGSDQMWSSERGNSTDQWIVTGLKSSGCYAFNIEVIDLGNGFCSMRAYGLINWD